MCEELLPDIVNLFQINISIWPLINSKPVLLVSGFSPAAGQKNDRSDRKRNFGPMGFNVTPLSTAEAGTV